MKDLVSINEREFISVKRASEITKYSKDYVGQLCREGKVAARMIGRTWFIDHESILNYKKTTDDQFFANYGKQKEIQQFENDNSIHSSSTPKPANSSSKGLNTSDLASYQSDLRPLMPVLNKGSIKQSEMLHAVVNVRKRARSISWPKSRFSHVVIASVMLLLFVFFPLSYVFIHDYSGNTSPISYDVNNAASVASLVDQVTTLFKNIFIKNSRIIADDVIKPPPEYGGIVVVPSGESTTSDVLKKQIKESFSDEVEVRPDESGTTGVVTPVFKGSIGDNFMYVLVPVKDQKK